MDKEAMHLLPVRQDDSSYSDDDDLDLNGHTYESRKSRPVAHHLAILLFASTFFASVVLNIVLVNQRHRSPGVPAYSKSFLITLRIQY
jgi:hypothetical protein